MSMIIKYGDRSMMVMAIIYAAIAFPKLKLMLTAVGL
jgi:hypothetical protein